ncbi:GlxA family transcriptional regulator [Aromatoleum petrolei]|uniref:Helix-turn-helix domain-containing protein n=1 Tax=Aromatoleum petrolei TaxID=76116 RepID=A0ABX1MRI0_9RHOO|nr:GlxA family transcriptional regulator [Aromatoleum petrolei]NMF87732.1 helix-turn-helix domain-containing protein [Aromatoleum petrolei]QTQ38220.1 Transcriptional regulator, AraC family [Aromatoleum petrolei]
MRWDRPVDVERGAPPLDITVLLLPPVSLGTLGAIVDPFVEANRVGGQRYYAVHLVSADGAPVALPGGGRLSVGGAISSLVRCDALVVASDLHQPGTNAADIVSQLKRIARVGAAFCGNRGGAGWLAEAGLLENRRVAVHWEDMTLYRERHPELVLCATLYEIDADRLTASSSQATLDMMLCVIAQQLSPRLADDVARQLGLDRIRPGHEKQAVPAKSRISQHPPKLTEALLVMEANLEEPLGSDEIAECVGISRRQLERLFKQNLDILPSRYYQELRLERARQLIVRTQQSIVQIGLSCGFSSGSHFATAYRAHFGITPREDRSRATLTGSQGMDSRAAGTPPTEPSW